MATMPQLMAMVLGKFRDQYAGSFWDKLWFILRRVIFFARSYFMDVLYVPIKLEELEEALEEWRREVLPNTKYMPEIMDCDDFAFYFKVWLQKWTAEHTKAPSNGVGVAIGALSKGSEVLGGHAWSIVLVMTEHGEDVVFVEPQTGEILENFKSSDGYEYTLQSVII